MQKKLNPNARRRTKRCDQKMNKEGKIKAYEEMCALTHKKGKNKEGKYELSFDEVADIVSRNMGIQQHDVLQILEGLKRTKKG